MSLPHLDSLPTLWSAYLAPEGFEADLITELGNRVQQVLGRLVITAGEPLPAAWAQNIWQNPRLISVPSIGAGAKALRALQRNWVLWPTTHHRRARLIQEQLPFVSAKPVVFPSASPSAPLGSWTLIEPDLMIASPACSSPFPNGEVHFVEDKTTPPNRAYLKLWEAFTRLGAWPQPGQRCVDLGSSPGGWTWVLQRLGSSVISVDKASLDPRIGTLPGIEFRQESAFGLSPQDIGPVDWLCSDIICYPERLLRLVNQWLDSGLARHMVVTIKFQGATDHAAAKAFAAIPGSQIMHLYHNKHELTWIYVADSKS